MSRPADPVVVLVKRFPRLSETFVLNEFLELRRQGVPVRLLALQDPMEPRAQPEALSLRPEVRYLRDGRTVARVIAAALAWSLRRPRGVAAAAGYAARRRSATALRHLADALVLASHLRQIRARHLHAHFAHSPTETAYLTHLVTGVPFSFTAHAKDLYTTAPSRIREPGRAAVFVATCTRANGTYLRDLLGREPVVCPHGLDIERFSAVPRSPVPGRILSIGRLVPKKGHHVLLDALAELRSRGVSFECRIVGSGPAREELVGRAGRLGLGDLVTFAEARPQTELLDEYAAAEIFALTPVLSSDGDRDGMPNVLLEAMGSGVPVVTTSISGIPEVVGHEDAGLLVPPGDALALAGALERLLGDAAERKRLAEGARAAVATRRLDDCVRPLARLLGGASGGRESASEVARESASEVAREPVR